LFFFCFFFMIGNSILWFFVFFFYKLISVVQLESLILNINPYSVGFFFQIIFNSPSVY
jgi:hypothetical protein